MQEPLLKRPASLPVLVLEDDRASRERLATVLEGAGYPVVWVDSEAGFHLPSGSKILGIVSGVPSVNGVDFPVWLSQHFPDLVQRVVLTGNAASEKACSKAGPAGWSCVQAPFQPRRLLSVVAKAMGEPQATERVLVVDDEETLRDIFASMLGGGGIRCRSVAGGGQALELLDSGEQFDLVTSDLMNAPLDGVSFLKQVRNRYPEVPVLIITTVHDPRVVVEAVRHGAYDYYRNPSSVNRFLSTFGGRWSIGV